MDFDKTSKRQGETIVCRNPSGSRRTKLTVCRETNPLLDTRFWTLLTEIVSPTENLSLAPRVNVWLVPLLARIPVSPIAMSFLELLYSLDEHHRHELTPLVYRVFVVIWPLSVHKFGFEALSDCFVAVLRVFKLCESDESLAQICCLITSSFRASLANASTRKKVYSLEML